MDSIIKDESTELYDNQNIENFIPDKPFKTYLEQINHLTDVHKLNINNVDRAINILKTLSYYDLVNGYKEHFMVNDIFKEDIDIDFIYLYSLFDKSFQNIIFKYSLIIERKFKNALAYNLASMYGEKVEDYLSKEVFIKPTDTKRQEKLDNTLQSINNLIVSDDLQQPSKHYKENKNCIPPWILFKNINFNICIDIYSFLPNDMKINIFKDMISKISPTNNDLENFKNSLTIVRKFRNAIAHNDKFITYNTGVYKINLIQLRHLYLNTLLTNKDTRTKAYRNDRFGVFMAIIFLIEDDQLLFQLYIDFVAIFTIYEHDYLGQRVINEYLDNTGLPTDLITRFQKFFNINQ